MDTDRCILALRLFIFCLGPVVLYFCTYKFNVKEHCLNFERFVFLLFDWKLCMYNVVIIYKQPFCEMFFKPFQYFLYIFYCPTPYVVFLEKNVSSLY